MTNFYRAQEKVLNEAFNKLPKQKFPSAGAFVFRGIGKQEYEKLYASAKEGDEIFYENFFSSSLLQPIHSTFSSNDCTRIDGTAANPQVRIGTSGWHYLHWCNGFYPAGTPPRAFLPHYARLFDTAEINNSFYRLPTPETFEHWRLAVPEGFLFAVKASRFITHMKKLSDPQQSTFQFLSRVGALGDKLGPLLFQLPPNWQFNGPRLQAFLEALPVDYRYACEFRHPSWYNDTVYNLLAQHRVAFCVYDLAQHTSPRLATTDFAYVRLHGTDGKYAGSYSDAALTDWAEQCRQWTAQGKEVYLYFDNDIGGHAPFDAERLRQKLS